jgi:hypothetical protein
VRAGKDGAPVTDGVFPETKEFLAGYWIVDVDTPARAYELAAPPPPRRPRRRALNMAIEVREVMSGPPPEFLEGRLTASVPGSVAQDERRKANADPHVHDVARAVPRSSAS